MSYVTKGHAHKTFHATEMFNELKQRAKHDYLREPQYQFL